MDLNYNRVIIIGGCRDFRCLLREDLSGYRLSSTFSFHKRLHLVMSHSHGPVSDHVDCELVGVDDYNMPLQIAGIFIVLGVAALGALVPIAARASKRVVINGYVFLLFKCFGIGVILSTGLIHMFMPAVGAFSNPCLPEGWHVYEPWAAVFALIGAFFVHLIQTIVLAHFAQEDTHNHETHALHKQDEEMAAHDAASSQRGDSTRDLERKSSGRANPPEVVALSMVRQVHHEDGCATHRLVENIQNHHHSRITTFALEAGMLFHSIIIGVVLGVSDAHENVPLLIAISFHQLFEGFALSTTILECDFKSYRMPILMASAFVIATPVGQAIGIGIASSFEPNSPSALLSTGILDAFAAGILIYDGFVNLLTPAVTHNHKFARFSGAKKLFVFLALWTGAAAMAVVGKWA